MSRLPVAGLTASAVLLLLLAALSVGFSGGVRDADVTRDSDQLASEYDRYLGQAVHFWGRVRSVDPLVVSSKGTRLTVIGGQPNAAPGDVVQVYGLAEADRRIVAERIVVSDRTGRQRMFAVSLLAPVLALLIAWRRWTVRTTDWRIGPRDA
jgi:hypothetical protein